MKKKYLKLTQEQKNRGVIFSSELVGPGMNQVIHEVFKDDKDLDGHIDRLKDDKFFNGSSFKYNLIRQ